MPLGFSDRQFERPQILIVQILIFQIDLKSEFKQTRS